MKNTENILVAFMLVPEVLPTIAVVVLLRIKTYMLIGNGPIIFIGCCYSL